MYIIKILVQTTFKDFTCLTMPNQTFLLNKSFTNKEIKGGHFFFF